MKHTLAKSRLFVLALLFVFLGTSGPLLALSKTPYSGVSGLKAGQSRWVVCSGNPINRIDPDGLDPISDVYGINSTQQQDAFNAGAAFFLVTGTVLTLGLPDPSDAAVWAVLAKGGHKARKAGNYFKIGKKEAHPDERDIAKLFADQGDTVYLVGRRVKGTPDININEKWWEIKTIQASTKLGNGVDRAIDGAVDRYRDHLIINAPGFSTGEVKRNIISQMQTYNRDSWKAISTIKIRGSNGIDNFHPWKVRTDL